MGKRISVFVVASLSALILLWPDSVPRSLPYDASPAALLSELALAFQAAEPGTVAAFEIEQSMRKVRAKSTQPRQDFPDELQRAFAEIKQTADGSSYPRNYLVREFDRALKRKTSPSKSLDWKWRGPGNVSGRVRCVVVDAADPSQNTWFAASIGGGIWKSADAGSSWQLKSPELTALSTTWLAQAASNTDVFYAATGMGYGRVVDLAGAGLWKSIDHGESWQQLASTANGELLEAINRVVVDPQDENTLLVCSNDGFSHLGTKGGERKSAIFRSTDGGQSWTKVFDADAFFGTTTDNRVQQLIHHPDSFSNIYASVNEVGVIRSTDGGLNWVVSANNFALPSDVGNPSGNGFGLAGISVRTELAIAPTDANRLYAAVERPRGIADLYMSVNGGTSWTLLPDTGTDPNWFNAFSASGAVSYTAGWFDNTIAVHPYDENIVFVGGVNLFRININAGANTRQATQISNWIQGLNLPLVHADHHALVCVPRDPATQSFWILDGNDGGIGYSTDGGQSWLQLTGMQTTQFYGVDKKPGEDVYIGGTQDNGTWLSQDQPGAASTWRHVIGGDGFEVAWNDNNKDWLLGGSQAGGFARSTDGGITWNAFSIPQLGAQPFITKIASRSPDPDLVFAVGQFGIARSDNFGRDWTMTPLSNWVGYRPFTNVEISSRRPQIVWATSRRSVDPPSGLRGGVHVSSDSGLTYQHVTNLPSYLDESSGLATHPLEANTAYLLFSAPGQAKVWMTTDLGQNWQDLSGFHGNSGESLNGFPDVAVFSFLVMPHNPNEYWAGTEIGLFVSDDAGSTWRFADNGLPSVAIFEMSIVDDQILLATQGLGIWTLEVPELLEVEKPDPILNPRVSRFAMHPSGQLLLEIELRSAYERTQVFLNGAVAIDLPANEADTLRQFWIPADSDNMVTLSLASHKQGLLLKTAVHTANVFAAIPAMEFDSDFNNDLEMNNFVTTAFSRQVPLGFGDGAAHTPHPYAAGQDNILWLKTPIVVQDGETLISYDDIALVEPGSGSGVFGDPQFWDYVIVEGSNNGTDWLALAPGYDSRFDANWLATYNQGSPVNETLFVPHEINVNDTFMPGDQIFVRFRLVSDPAVTGWGWCIDNVRVTGSGALSAPERQLIYPWISNNDQFESLLIANNLGDREALVDMTARRQDGASQSVQRVIKAGGFLREQASTLFSELGSGSGYTVVLETNNLAVRGNWVTNNLFAASGRSPSQGVAIATDGSNASDLAQVGHSIMFGYLPKNDGWTSAPVIVNVGDQDANITMDFYDSAGQLVLSDDQTLSGVAPFRPFAAVVNQLVNESGNLMMIARADVPLTGVSFTFNQGAEPAIGNALDVTSGDSKLLFPWISKNTQFESILFVNNPNSQPANITLTARRGNGDATVVSRTVPANGFLEEFAGTLFAELGDGSGYAVEVDSDNVVTGGWVTYNLWAASGRSPSQGVAVNIGSNPHSSTQLLFPFLATTGGLTSAPVIVNTGVQSAAVQLSFYDRQGKLILKDVTSLASLQPFQPFASVANAILGVQSGDVYAIADSLQPLAGVAFVFNEFAEPAIGNAVVP